MRRLLPPAADGGLLDDGALIEAYRLPDGRSLRVNFITSLDGAATVDGVSEGLGSAGDRRVFQVLRALADVVLVGHGTAAAEGYRAVPGSSTVGRIRASIGRPAPLPIAVVSRRASLDPTSRLVTAAEASTVLVCGDYDVDLPQALDGLAELGHEQVLCEGGPALFRAALASGVVDELDLSLAPSLVGDGGKRLLEGALPDPAVLGLRQLLEEDGVLFTRYGVHRSLL